MEVASVGGRPRKAAIRFARVMPDSLSDQDLPESIRQALVPGSGAARHRRLWRMGQVTERDGYLTGRIGYQSVGVTELFDEDAQDFLEASKPEGTTSPFAVRLFDGLIAFQRRGSLIKPTSFTGAFQALLNDVSPFTTWRVIQIKHEATWEGWLATVDRVTELRFHLLRPNPHFADRDLVKALIDNTRSRAAEVVLKADEGDGLETSDRFVRQAAEHTEKYGTFKAKGEKEGSPPVVWSSDETVAAERTIEADPATGEAGPGQLIDLLEGGSQGSDQIEVLEGYGGNESAE